MNIGEKLFNPALLAEGEKPEQAEARVKRNQQVFKNALNNSSGRELLALLTSVSPPYAPRFSGEFDEKRAAYLDGEKHLIGLMVMHGSESKL